jgi:hypothetical protein
MLPYLEDYSGSYGRAALQRRASEAIVRDAALKAAALLRSKKKQSKIGKKEKTSLFESNVNVNLRVVRVARALIIDFEICFVGPLQLSVVF